MPGTLAHDRETGSDYLKWMASYYGEPKPIFQVRMVETPENAEAMARIGYNEVVDYTDSAVQRDDGPERRRYLVTGLYHRIDGGTGNHEAEYTLTNADFELTLVNGEMRKVFLGRKY